MFFRLLKRVFDATSRRVTTLSIIVGAMCIAAMPSARAADPNKVVRYAFRIAETSFDPATISDLYSSYVVAAIFDPLVTYDYLARPYKLKPNVLVDMPTVSEDGTVFTFRIKPGIYFTDDPAFNGKKRELVAADFVYGIKRHFDPRWRSNVLYLVDHIEGMDKVVAKWRETKVFDYDMPVRGFETPDKHTLIIRLKRPDFLFLYRMTDSRFGGVAREVVEKYGDSTGDHPVGTGPYRLAFWRKSSRIVLEANPGYRDEVWESEPPANDEYSQAIAKRLSGKKIPMVGRIEISIIEEPQPRWLAFLNEEHDVIDEVPFEFSTRAAPGGKLAADLAARGMKLDRVTRISLQYTYFGMENKVVGGYTPDKVALRRAMTLGYYADEEINIVRKGQAIRANSPIAPGANGFDPDFRSETVEYDPGRAKALLDMYGYVDKDGDGYRENPDGSKLVITLSSAPDMERRQLTEVWIKSMKVIGIRMEANFQKWPDLLKESRAGKLQMWGVGWTSTLPDADSFLQLLYGPNSGQSNHSRFNLPAYNKMYEATQRIPNSPERNAIFREMNRTFMAYSPWTLSAYPIWNNLTQPWVIGYRMNPVMNSVWKFVDVDLEEQKRRKK
ncbi:MAG: bicyclomycin resistance protein [Betaproteobacteria bacterium]|nr:bicyclomycin resistance protein [Betaproteobacteria bacterium]